MVAAKFNDNLSFSSHILHEAISNCVSSLARMSLAWTSLGLQGQSQSIFIALYLNAARLDISLASIARVGRVVPQLPSSQPEPFPCYTALHFVSTQSKCEWPMYTSTYEYNRCSALLNRIGYRPPPPPPPSLSPLHQGVGSRGNPTWDCGKPIGGRKKAGFIIRTRIPDLVRLSMVEGSSR